MNANPLQCLLRSCAVFAALCCAAPACLGADFAEWHQRASFEVAAPGLHRVALTPAMLEAARPGLEDLRLADPSGSEIPFVIHIPLPEAPAALAPRSFQTRLVPAATTALIETGTPSPIESVTLESPGRSFIKAARLEGSKDGRMFTLLIEGAPLFRQINAEHMTLRMAPGVWPWLRLTVDDARSQPVPFTSALIHTAMPEAAPLEPTPARVTATDHAGGFTRLVLDLGSANLTVAELEFEIADALFQRPVLVGVAELVGGELRETELARGLLFSIDVGVGSATRQMRVALHRQVKARELILRIEDGDSPPLKIGAVRAFCRPVSLIFQARAPGAHHLFLGNGLCPAPRYDLGGFSGRLGQATASWINLGPLSANPGYRKPDTLPGLAETGAQLDTKKWRLRKAVTLRRSGVQQLELDLDVLSHARADLADLRLMRDGLQVPYLIEHSSLLRKVSPVARLVENQKRPGLSRWSLTLSHARLPLVRLQCRSRTALFQRHVRLFEQVPDGRGGSHERDLGGATWQRGTDAGNPPLGLVLEGRPESAVLFLEMDNGDNPPIELEAFEVAYPVTRLVFKTTEAPELIYGHAKAHAPRYDVALVARPLLMAERSAAETGTEQGLDGSLSTEGEPLSGIRGWIFWGVLTAVVIGLIAVMARLLPKPNS